MIRRESASPSSSSFEHREDMVAELATKTATVNLKRSASDRLDIAVNKHRFVGGADHDGDRSRGTPFRLPVIIILRKRMHHVCRKVFWREHETRIRGETRHRCLAVTDNDGAAAVGYSEEQ